MRPQNDGAVADYIERVHEAQARASRIQEREKMFGWEPSDFDSLNELASDLAPYASLWAVGAQIDRALPEWMTGPFARIGAARRFLIIGGCVLTVPLALPLLLRAEPEAVETQLGEWSKQLYRLAKTLGEQPACAEAIAAMRAKVRGYGGRPALFRCRPHSPFLDGGFQTACAADPGPAHARHEGPPLGACRGGNRRVLSRLAAATAAVVALLVVPGC
jgi:hypothetical protein